MSKLAVYTKPNANTITVRCFSDRELAIEGRTIEDLCKETIPAGVTYALIDPDPLLKKDHLRKAWKLNNDKIDIDLDKAKPLQVDYIRKARNKKFEEFDKEYTTAQRDGDATKVTALETKRQQLKDIPQDCESQCSNINDVDTLKALWHPTLDEPIYSLPVSNGGTISGMLETATGLTSL